MRGLKLVFTVLTLFFTTLVFGQKGFVRGSVFDGKTGEFLPGVTIFVEGTTLGTITDLDGKFNLSIDPGTYQLRVSFISYETLHIDDVIVEPGEATVLDNLKLEEATIQLEEAVVTASYLRNTETAMLTMKKKSVTVLDGISSAGLKKIGDSDAASSMKRVTGVSVEGGKYVFVRGLGDRYTKTMLNGLDIPGLDPDRNTIQMDIFPTSIIDNLVVNKSFSAELPADFTGGVINISIKDFPESKKANISMSAGYNSSSHFNSNYLTYEGGDTDWLGFDDGTRDIPATENIPFFTDAISHPEGTDGQRYREILQNFDPNMAAVKEKSFMDYSFGASLGNQFEIGKYTLGYTLSASYKNNTDFYENAEYGRYGLLSDADVTEMEVREHQTGNYGVNNVLLSGLAGLALKTKRAKYRLYVLHLQNGESQAGIFNYAKSNQGTEFSGFQHNLQYSQRALSNLLLDGKYSFYEKGWELEWKFSPTFSSIEDPDIRFTRYLDRNGNYSIGTEVGFPERIWRELEEVNYAGVIHVTKDFKFNDEDAKLKFGGAYTYKERDFIIRKYMINVRDLSLTGDPDELFKQDNLWPYNGDYSRGVTYDASFVPNNPNQYNSNVNNVAGYASVELNPIKRLKAIVGLRVESYTQHYTGQNQLGTIVLDNEEVLNDLDFFPALNFIYSLSENQNLRFSYSKTIARPSFKELSYAEIYDPVSGRTFVGGLFRDADDIAGVEYWDGNLTSTDIHNFDFRWELFYGMGQTVSAGVFYKKFRNPIEMVQYFTLVGSFQPRNVGDGEVVGAEIELRQSLQPLSEKLKNFNFNFNYTYTHSQIELSSTEYQSRLDNARTGQSVGKYRDMAGQAPYIINAGFAYDGGEQGFWNGLEAGVYYNVQGQTLQYVGIVDRPDIYTVPFHSLNLNASKSFGEKDHFQVGFKIDNILNDKKESVFKSYDAGNQYFERLSPGTTFQFKLGYSF
ncbi:TonB-dependent receptor plug domain-containing protein [Maribellus comscasis]|uniref:TonB-dependent receptor plug domain-containing protein n=1 Tax=Maribellus comscasis TaxID=2681766 RepID=A0A6I6JLP0_9BACT|nr:TonB-dependent receptor [Maribellus comscasis]QGY43746.1 TonB-dependent receptor plug domain-containing protein [Maribellus comscasis]